jgi:cytochrome c-type biogenesis protein CcmH/NrfG
MIWPLSVRRWNWNRRAFSVLVLTAVLTVAGAVVYRTAPNVRDRFDQLVRDSGELSRPILWRAGWDLFRAHPVVGSGAGSYNVLFERHRPAGFLDEPQWAHNDYLNTLSDYGAIGFVLLFGAGGVIVFRQRRIARQPGGVTRNGLDSDAVRAGLAIGVLAFAIQLVVDFHFKIPALAMTFAVIAALALGETPATAAHSSSPAGVSQTGWLIAVALLALMMVPMFRFHRAEALRYRARQSMDEYAVRRTEDSAAVLRRAEEDLRRATSLAPRHGGAWADLAFALELRAFDDPAQNAALADPAANAAERATELSRAVSEFWIRLGVARDMQARRDEAEKAFERSLRLAPQDSRAWYYYAYHLSYDTERREAALRAIATCLSLDPGNGAAEALRVKLYERSSALFIQ